MRNRWLFNLGLLLLVVLLGLTLYYLRATEQRSPAPQLTALTPAAIERARIVFADGQEVSLQKQHNRWSLVTPVRARASQAMMHNLMALATATSSLQLPANTENLKKYGLDVPKAKLWLNDTEFGVGIEHPFKDARYVLHDNQIKLVAARNFMPAAYRYHNLIDKRLLEEGDEPVAIVLPQQSLQLRDGKWKVQAGNLDLTPNQINAFFDDWRFARAFAVEPYSGRAVLDRIRLTLQHKDNIRNRTLELAVLSYTPEFVLYRSDENLEYRFTEQTGKRLLEISSES